MYLNTNTSHTEHIRPINEAPSSFGENRQSRQHRTALRYVKQ